MQFSGNCSSLALGLDTRSESSSKGGQRPPDMVWDLSNNPNYGFLGHVPNVSQLGLSRLCAANEFCEATVTPHVVRVHSMVEYHRIQDEPGVVLPPFHGTGEVSIAEIARPYYPHALLNGVRLVLSTERRDCLQNDMAGLPLGDPPTDNGNLLNEVNEHREFPTVAEQADPWSQSKVAEKPTIGFDDSVVPIGDKPIDAEPLQVYIPDDVRDRNNILHPKAESNNDRNLDTNGVTMNVRRLNYRRTCSAPYRKYGPYTCPRCMDVFPTSQSFAAHVSAHYRRDGDSAVRKPIVSIQNTERKRMRANRRPVGRHVPYMNPGLYPCAKCNVMRETPRMFAAHLTSHSREEVVRGQSRDAANGPRNEIPNPNCLEEAVTLLPIVDWLASTLRKVQRRHSKGSSDQNIDIPEIPPQRPSSSSSSSAPQKAGAGSAVKMELDPEDDDDVVEVDAFGMKIKKEPWSI